MSVQADLTTAHRLIMQAAEGPSMALLRNKGNRSLLAASVKKLRAAADLIEGVIGK